MKYENASDILPEKLVREIQKYAAGKLLYIPTGEEKRAWGEMSGYRDRLQRRNIMIRNKYASGLSVSDLADEYFLSLDSIKKIIYSKKTDRNMTYAPTVGSAVKYASIGMLEEWIQCYLLLTQKVTSNIDEFTREEHLYFGVVKFPLRLIQLDGIVLDKKYANEAEDNVSDLPPLIIQYKDGKFYCTEQKEVFAALKQHKVNAYPAIVILKETMDYKRFMSHYGNVLFFINEL
ncbi:CD3324 family protein [Paenibacillus gallinarum]|uniref:CD3324 family protein n=1 Tax=Paenibacillus gallinarum TaxID=2762232 RepID=UPI00296A960F|nr:CD3324 family protein [Paenibacillus gallinarum]